MKNGDRKIILAISIETYSVKDRNTANKIRGDQGATLRVYHYSLSGPGLMKMASSQVFASASGPRPGAFPAFLGGAQLPSPPRKSGHSLYCSSSLPASVSLEPGSSVLSLPFRPNLSKLKAQNLNVESSKEHSGSLVEYDHHL